MNVGWPTAPERLSPVSVHTRVAHNDTYSKGKMAEYFNARRHTTHSEMTPGDYVLVKQPKKNTLTTPYNAMPCLVKEKKGSMITARRPDGSLITRNSSHFRRLPPHITTPSDITEPDAPESETPPPDTNVSEDVSTLRLLQLKMLGISIQAPINFDHPVPDAQAVKLRPPLT